MIKLIPYTTEHEDCTIDYDVFMDKIYTVKEFIDEILTKNEWGKIKIYDERQTMFDELTPNCEFKKDKLITEISKDNLVLNVKSASASGGYSCMDYILYI